MLQTTSDITTCEVLIVGGGPAGISCALSIARGGGSLVICDDKKPRNENSKHISNIPGLEGIAPKEYLELIGLDLKKYQKVISKEGQVVAIEKKNNLFISSLSNNEVIKSRRVVIAEGVIDQLPDIPGLRALWGKSVFHCAYCHGYENINKKFGLLVKNEKGMQMVRLLWGLNSNLVIFSNGHEIFNEHDLFELKKRNIPLFHEKVLRLIESDEKLQGVILDNQNEIPCDKLFIQNEVKPRSDLGKKLGCKEDGKGIYKVNEDGMSSVEGVYFAGDVGSHNQSVIMASALGSHVGICVNADLMREVFNGGIKEN